MVSLPYGSVCSGIGAPECAWQGLGGYDCKFSAEIEPFPAAVYCNHFPNTPNYGDITKFKSWPDHRGAIRLLVGGTPCQAFSVAGLRKGLADPRGNLTLTFLAITERYDPTWLLWENVPGVLSDEGNAFGCFLGGLAKLGYGFAYRVLDAQYFGVAQRRRRVFVVGHSGGQWQRAAAVLFERESMCGHPAPSREAGQRVAPTVESRANAGGAGWGTDFLSGGGMTTLQEASTQAENTTGETHNTIPSSSPLNPNVPDIVGTLSDGAHRGGEPTDRTPTLDESLPSVAWALQERDAKGCDSDTKEGHLIPVRQGGFFDEAIGFQPRIARNGRGDMGDHVNALNAQSGQSGKGDAAPCVAVAVQEDNQNGVCLRETAGSLRSDAPGTQPCGTLTMQNYAVRRLTPTEYERLQGFPDGWTAITYKGKPAADGPRYRALGNSMAVPVIRWLGQRIALVDSLSR